ncbi:L-lactate permease [Massilia sp. BSC265]|uniref:L-lactate permease n=1 Tax=Massilia sp. BSC265 TaxID=1549812 RepID=UPI0004E90810|nr:L-lactate permease [Massilia sp. BSC265]KFI08604.1 lactate permease [Massilia sp. BSC265]
MLAALPILVVLVMMIGLRASAARAGSAGLVAAVIIAVTAFGLGSTVLPRWGVVGSVGGAMAEATFTALTILWIIFPALCIHEMQLRTGSMDVLQGAMGRITGDPRILALLIAWFFVLFVEGAAGFGTSVALAAPFLVSAGFGRVAAVSIALIGHAVGVSFGAVGTPLLPQVAASGLPGLALAGTTAAYHVLLGWMMPLAVMLLATRALPGDARMAPSWGWALFAALCFLLPYYVLARFVGPELPTLAGALLGAALFVAALKIGRRSTAPAAAPKAPGAGAAAVLKAGAPYLLLIVLVLVTRLVPAIKTQLGSVTLAWSSGPFGGSMQILYHPGTMLLASFLLAALLTGVAPGALVSIMTAVVKRLLPVCAALLAMLGLSRVMVHAGMIDALASSASGAGALWPLLAPAIGALGTFVTGSATASNILFTEFQVATARQLGLSVLGLSAAQGFGAAVGNIICPHNIVAASATVNLVGREGEVLRRTVVVTVVYCALGGLAALLLFA